MMFIRYDRRHYFCSTTPRTEQYSFGDLVPFHTKYGMVVPGTYREGVSLMFVLLNRKLFFLYKNTMMIYVITEQSFKEENLDKFRYCCF
jgi:hypothetical protein